MNDTVARLSRRAWPLICGCLWLAVSAVNAAGDAAHRPDVGQGAIHLDAVESVDSDSPTPPDDRALWRKRALPDRWLDSGRSDVGSVWYRLTLPRHPATEGGASLWIPKLSMNVQLWLNGKRLAATSDAARGMTTRFWNSPWLVPMPIDAAGGAATADAPRVVHLRVTAVAANDGGLSALWWGGAEALRARHEALSFVRVTLPAWCVAFGLSLGLVFVFVWMHNHTQQPWGYFGAASVVWGLSNLNLTLTRVPMPDAWWETCVQLFNFLGPWLLILFGFSFTGALTRRLAPWLWAHAALTSAFLLATSDQSTHWKSPLVTAPLLILGFWALITIARWIRLNAVSAGLLFPTVASVTFIAASHDWAIQAGLISVEQPFLLVLASPLLLSTIAWLLAADYARAQHGLQQLNLDLDSRVRAREAQLQTSFEHQGRIESALAVAEERSRILRDIHDGAGSHLSTAIRLIEHGTAQPAAVALTLREALDQLKLSIDTLNVLPGDVVALLANLRYRLEPRMADAGITLSWSIDALPPWPGGQRERAMQNLQFIMFEIVSNVLQHAHATALRVEAAVSNTGRTIRLTFADNGKGLAPSSSAVPPLITTIRKRVAMIGATLDVADASPGLSLVIELPLEG